MTVHHTLRHDLLNSLRTKGPQQTMGKEKESGGQPQGVWRLIQPPTVALACLSSLLD